MIKARGDNITMKIFLWFIFIVLGLSMAFWLFSMYQQYISSGEIEKGTLGTLGCSGYTFKIFGIDYEGEQLTFTIKNTIGDPIDFLEIKSEFETRTEDLGYLSSGREKQIILKDFKIKDNFVVYPEGCLRYNSKEFIRTDKGWQKR